MIEWSQVLRFLRARGASKHVVSLVHDLWLSVTSKPDNWIADPKSYLFRMAENLIRDSRKHSVKFEQGNFGQPQIPRGGKNEPMYRSPVDVLEWLDEVNMALEKLGPTVQQIFHLHIENKISLFDISRDMGMSLILVENNLKQAYAAIAEIKIRYDDTLRAD